MKRLIGYAAILALVSVPAFAAKNSQSITISHPVTVGTTQIPAADYKVTWIETGSNAQVTFTHDKSVITVPAKVVKQTNNVKAVQTVDKNGVSVLVGIDLNNVSVEFTSAPDSGQ